MFSQLFLFLHFVVKKDKQETREKQKKKTDF
jgi:hypothetical protein